MPGIARRDMKQKQLLQITLGIVTSVGGFLEIGSIATAAQAGAAFGYQLVWSVVLGTLCIAFLTEMSGRFAACSQHTIPDAMRERFGMNAFAIPLVVMLLVSLLVLGAEMGGLAVALELATSVKLPVWAVPAALVSWGILWRASFGTIENGVCLLGLLTIVFAVGAVKAGPDYVALLRGVVPTMPRTTPAHYWFVAVSVLGASVSPYLYYFYSSGAIEEHWNESYLKMNRWVAGIGMGFGGLLSVAVLVLAAILFHPRGQDVETYHDLPKLLTPVLGRSGFWLFVAALGIACFGATLEIALSLAYLVAQGFGWQWGKSLPARDDARFSLTYTLLIVAGALFVLLGMDPLQLTQIGMALTSASLPLGVLPFLILMNDRDYLGEHVNGHIGNGIVLVISLMAMVLAVVSIPLELVGG